MIPNQCQSLEFVSCEEKDATILVAFLDNGEVWYELEVANPWRDGEGQRIEPAKYPDLTRCTSREEILRNGNVPQWERPKWTKLMLAQELLRRHVNYRLTGIERHWAELEAREKTIREADARISMDGVDLSDIHMCGVIIP